MLTTAIPANGLAIHHRIYVVQQRWPNKRKVQSAISATATVESRVNAGFRGRGQRPRKIVCLSKWLLNVSQTSLTFTLWRRSVVVSGVGLINEVNRHRARLVLGWLTV